MSDNVEPPPDVSLREKLRALWAVATYRPGITLAIVIFSIVTTLLEGIGLGFLLPIIEYARTGGAMETEGDMLLELFVAAYSILGLPFTLGFIVLGVGTVMTVRIALGFVVGWLTIRIQTHYVRDLQLEAFDRTLDARLQYFDRRGSDEILNELVTRVYYAESVFGGFLGFFQQGLMALMYLAIAFYLAPMLAIVMTVLFVALALTVRILPERAYAIGDRVARAHEQVQSTVQAGTQGVQDVKLFGMSDELFSNFRSSVNRYANSTVALGRNQLAMESSYHLIATLLVFVMIYVAIGFTSLTLGELGVFMFAVYRLGPTINGLNGLIYELQGSLPHFVRMRRFIADLDAHQEGEDGSIPVPQPVDEISFDRVRFGYDDEPVLNDVSLSFDRGEFIGVVGPSGAGKSTLAALIARLYDPDSGDIMANDIPIDHFAVDEWRSRIAVVPQHPHIFNKSLRYNLTFGSRHATESEIERVCEDAQITEFLDELPDGLETELGDNGVRLSGGQRQRVEIARALLRDADILVLDEATSDLDNALERKVHERIKAGARDHAVVVIAHRLESVRDADRIYALEDGKISEVGNHRELLANNGIYAELYAGSD